MTRERWEEIRTILAGAKRHGSAAEVRTYLDEACANSASLREETEALLRHQEGQDGPLSAFSSLTGKRLLHYQLLEKAGEGTTSVLYKAHDTVLKRFVVVKVLRPLVAADPDSVKRFLREAQVASVLSHPNIATIHDFG